MYAGLHTRTHTRSHIHTWSHTQQHTHPHTNPRTHTAAIEGRPISEQLIATVGKLGENMMIRRGVALVCTVWWGVCVCMRAYGCVGVFVYFCVCVLVCACVRV